MRDTVVITIGLVAVFVAGFVLGVSEACAADLRLGGFIRSEHHDREHVNEDHRESLFIFYNGWTVGRYENSWSETAEADRKKRYSNFVAHQWEWRVNRNITVGTLLGAATGYKDIKTDAELLPVAGLTFKYHFGKSFQLGRVSVAGWETPNLLD